MGSFWALIDISRARTCIEVDYLTETTSHAERSLAHSSEGWSDC